MAIAVLLPAPSQASCLVDDTQEHPGPLGRVDERLPHPACDACFTVPGLNEDRYTLFESVTVDDRENLILREIPNPAPLSEGEVRETVDEETGEPLWYIGRQAYSGPYDTDVVSDELQIPLIELKRTKAQQANTIMSIPGVHRSGIGERGFVVTIAPGYDAARIPQTIDGVPVEVQVRDLAVAYNHANERLRPVPTGAGITSVRTGTTTLLNNGTLGPPIVRTVGGCCQIWSLTAAHVVKHQLHDPNPAAGTQAVYQPTITGSNFFGYVAHAFHLTSCGPLHDVSGCFGAGAVENSTMMNPDVAAIDPLPYGVANTYPHNTPTGTDPTRRMQKTASTYINGPSGVIRSASVRDKHSVWGSHVYDTARVSATGLTLFFHQRNHWYRICCVNQLETDNVHGDSGALVSYRGTGKRHVASLLMGGDGVSVWYIPAAHIKAAFNNADVHVSHFWGAKSAYRTPATQTCDPPGC